MTTLASFPLRLPKSIKAEAERQSRDDGTSLNQFIAIAVAEKIAARQTAAFFEARIARALAAERRGEPSVLELLLDRTGGEPPREGDELPEGYVPLPRGKGAAANATKAPPKRRRTAGGAAR